MKKVYFLKVFMSVVLAMLLTVGNVFADRGWVRVTHNTTLSVGDTIIIAAASDDYQLALGTQQNTNNRGAAEITKSGNMAVLGANVQMLILQQSTINGAFMLYDPDANGGYLYAPCSGNHLKTTTTIPTNGAADWIITVFNNDSITIVSQNESQNQVYMRFNSGGTTASPLGLFSCYSATSSIINPVTIYRYEEVQEATVATPEFTPDGGTYYTPQTVSLSCATTGATILYTLDGSEPAMNGAVYSTPLNISTNTTVKAIAFLGTDTSFMSQATYTFPIEVADIAAFKTMGTSSSTPYRIAGDVTFVFHSGVYTYVKDASAGLLVYEQDPVITNVYNEGDVISGGLCGTYAMYNGQVEMKPTLNPAVSTQNTGTVQPVVVTMADLLANYATYDAQLITLENVSFPNGFTGASQTVIQQGDNSMTLFNRFSLDTTLAAGTVTNVTGFAAKYGTTIQIYPRGNFDLSSALQPAQPSLTVTLNGEQFSTLDTLQVGIDVQNFVLGTDGLLKLEGDILTVYGGTNPMYLNDQLLAVFLAQTFSPLPAGTHTVTASLVDVQMNPLTPAVSQSVTFTVTAPVAEAPVFSPDAGTYADSVVVSLACATTGAQIRYTTDGTAPVATSTLYENPFTLNATATIKAKAFMNNVSWEDSPVAEATYTIVSVPTLTVDPTSLTFSPTQLTGMVNINSASLTDPITVSCDNAHFTLSATSFPANVGNTSFTVTFDNQEPATGNIVISSGTLSAQVSLLATAQLPAPIITPASGTTDTLIVVEMTDAVQNAGIVYTLDGTDPNETSTAYSQPIVLDVPGTYTLKARALYEGGWIASEITTATYTVVAPVVPSIDTIIYTVGFEAEEGFAATQTYNNTSVVFTGAEGHQWGTYYGTPATNEHLCGAQSMQMRWYSSAPANLGYTYTNFDLRNVTYVTFDAKQNSGLKLNVSYSIDGGNTYVGDSLYNIATSRQNYRFNVSETGEHNFVRLKFAVVLPETNPTASQNKLIIDSVVVFGVEGIVADVVEMPVIAPNSGTYYDAFNATITCATTDAVIRYTTDGTEPTVNSTVYTAPIAISTTTTLKAKAWKEGMEPSFVATATYNFPPEVANIAAFKAASTATNNTVYKIAGDVTFVFRNGRYIMVEDASAALMIYDNNPSTITTTYNEGDVISGGVFGTYSLYHGMVEMVPARNTAEASGNTGTVTPLVATIPTLVSQYNTYECRLVTVENVTFIDNYKFVNGADTMTYYDNFNTVDNDPVAGSVGSITGFVAIRDGEVRLYPRNDNDFNVQVVEQVATPVFTPAPGEYENDGDFELSISCATDGATIYYTLDGTEPNENSTIYTEPISWVVLGGTWADEFTIKAIAMKAGMLNSEVAVGVYNLITSIRDMDQQVSIYPNPTSSDVTLDLSGLNARMVELFSANGQLLNTVVPTNETMTLSLSNYAAGIYFVRIHSDKAVTTQKIIKQ